MKAISVQQPWASLIIERRRHIIIKSWQARPGERFAIHASHVRNDELARQWFADCVLDRRVPKNAILGVVEVRKCLGSDSVRSSKFDVHNAQLDGKKRYALVVRTIEKYRRAIPHTRTWKRGAVWEWELAEDRQAIGKQSE